MFFWNDEKVRFMEDAAAWSGFHAALAALLAPHLPPEGHICDAGCGTGHLSLALSRHVRRVTAVDMSGEALSLLAGNCQKADIRNITIRCGDIHALPPPSPYDAMVFCFFGHMEEILTLARQQCRGAVLAIMRHEERHRFSAGQPAMRFGGYERGAEVLRERGIPFQAQTLTLPMGQPFRTTDDARRFFELYRRPEDDAPITDTFLAGRLLPTGQDDFPWYLPSQRRFGLIRLDAGDIPDTITTL